MVHDTPLYMLINVRNSITASLESDSGNLFDTLSTNLRKQPSIITVTINSSIYKTMKII